MSKRDEIKAEIDKVAEEHLEQLHQLIKGFPENVLHLKKSERKDSRPLLKKLQDIKIDGPVDFAENWNLYVTGEKSIDANLP